MAGFFAGLGNSSADCDCDGNSVIPDPDRESSFVIPDPDRESSPITPQPDKSGQTDRLKPVFRHGQVSGKGPIQVQIAIVIHTKSNSPILDVCSEYGLKPLHIPYVSKQEAGEGQPVSRNQSGLRFEEQLLSTIKEKGLDLIVLAGFMKQLSASFIDKACIPIMNIHPALLPKFGGKGMYGMRVHEKVFASREEYSGATVHLVDPEYDHGRIIAQERVWIADCRSAEEIAARVLKAEHYLYGRAIVSFLSSSGMSPKSV